MAGYREVELDSADGVHRSPEPVEVDLHHVIDRNPEVGLDGLDQLVGPGVVGGVDPVVLADLAVSPATVTTVSRGMESTLTCTGRRDHVDDLDDVAALSSGVGGSPWDCCSAGVSPARESEPMSNTLNGWPTG